MDNEKLREIDGAEEPLIDAEAEIDAEKESSELKRTIIADEDDYEEKDISYRSDEEVAAAVKSPSRFTLFFSDHMTMCIISIIFAAAIVSLCFFMGALSGNSQSKINEKYAQIKENDSEYNSLTADIDLIGVKIDELSAERDRLQADVDALKSYESQAPEIEAQIESVRAEIESYNSDSAQKQEEINSITSSISNKIGSIVNLPSGIYTVGENITAGTYIVTGSDKILISNSKGGVKVNTVLTADGLSVVLDDGDKIQLDARAKFTPTQSTAENSGKSQ